MTNGEKLLHTFPQSREEPIGITKFIVDDRCYEFSTSWWNAEYKPQAEKSDESTLGDCKFRKYYCPRDCGYEGIDEKHEFLIDRFFACMNHSSIIKYPYYFEATYSHKIADDYINEHPDFNVPPKDMNNHYILSSELLQELKEYWYKQCKYYGYIKSEY